MNKSIKLTYRLALFMYGYIFSIASSAMMFTGKANPDLCLLVLMIGAVMTVVAYCLAENQAAKVPDKKKRLPIGIVLPFRKTE